MVWPETHKDRDELDRIINAKIALIPTPDNTGYSLNATLAVDAKSGANAVTWDGATDDTAKLALQATAALAAGLPLRLPPGTGMVTTWAPPSGLTVIGAGSGQTTIKQHPSATGANAVTVNLANTSDVNLNGLTVDGNVSAFSGVVSEWKHAINATNVTRLSFWDVIATHAKGDGIYIGKGSGHSTGITAYRLRCTANWRNGLTIADGADAKFVSCDFTNQTGTAPQAGVDIEPNDNTSIVSDIRFVACNMFGNAGTGLSVVMFPGGQIQERVKVTNCVIRNNTLQGVMLYGSNGVEFNGTDIVYNTLDGVFFQSGAILDTSFNGGRITANGHHGILCQPVTGSTVKNSKVNGTIILDNGSAAAGTTYYGMLWDQGAGLAGSVDGVSIKNVTSSNRSSANQKYGAYFAAAVINLTIDGNDFRGNVSSAIVLNDDPTTRLRGSNLGITGLAGISATSIMAGNGVTRASCTVTTPITLTLPVAPESGMEYLIYDASGNAATNNITIVPSAAHAFANVASLVLNKNFGFIKLYYRANKYFVVSSN